MNALNEKHRIFVEAYLGDPVEAMQVAGFKGSPSYLRTQGEKLLEEPLILEAIKQRGRYIAKTSKIIASREERQEFWTKIMYNEDPDRKQEVDDNGVPKEVIENIPLQTRLKASELLGKSEADFTENINQHTHLSISDLVQKSYKPTRSLEDIEADYYKAKQIQAPEDFI